MSTGNITSYPPVWPSAIFNSYLFQGTKYITRQEADLLYASTYSVRNIGYLNDVTEGIAQASKALILNSSANITGINNLQSSTIDCNGLNINNSTDLNLYGTTNSVHLHSTVSSTIQMSGTIFNSITMSGSSGFILMSGANQYVYLSGTSNYLRIDNNTASTSSITGSLRIAGGAYFGNHCLYNGNITLQGLSAILSLSGASSVISISNTTASTSSTTGALQVAGGAYFGANSLMAANLTLNGASSTLSLSGASSVISISNTSASTSSTTGAIRCSGGIYTGGDCLFNTNFQVNGIVKFTYDEASTSASTGTLRTTGGVYIGKSSIMAAKLTLNGASSTLSLTGASSVISISNTSASTSSTTGALRVAGGAYFGANSLFAGNVCIGGSTDTSRLISALNSSLSTGSVSICFGQSNSAGNQVEFTYTRENLFPETNTFSIGFHSNNNLLTIFNRSTPALNLIKLGNPPNILALSCVHINQSMALIDSSSNYCRFQNNILANNLNITLVNNSGVNQAEYCFSKHSLSLGLNENRFRLDLAGHGALTGTNNFLVSLYNAGLTSPTTGIGYVVSDNLFITSSGSNGIIFRNNNGISGTNAYINTGTRTHQMYKSGHFEATSGVRAGEYSAPTFYSGKGIEMHWSTSANLGDVFAYDRSNSVFLPLRFNSTIYVTAANMVGINKASPSTTLDVNGDITTNSMLYNLKTTGQYARLIWDHANSYYCGIGVHDTSSVTKCQIGFCDFSGSWNTSVFMTVLAGGFTVLSDYRLKENIQDLNIGLNEILLLKPKKYNLTYEKDRTNLGFLAHELQKIIPEVVDNNKDDIDEKGNPKMQNIYPNQIIPVLVNAIQEQNKLIINNQKLIESLQNQINKLQEDSILMNQSITQMCLDDETMYDMIEDIHNFLNINTE